VEAPARIEYHGGIGNNCHPWFVTVPVGLQAKRRRHANCRSHLRYPGFIRIPVLKSSNTSNPDDLDIPPEAAVIQVPHAVTRYVAIGIEKFLPRLIRNRHP
jgi:hypothetical protein